MATFDAASGAGTLRLTIDLAAQNIPGNTSTVAWNLYLICGNGLSWNSEPVGWSVNMGGAVYSGAYTFDFRGTNVKHIAAGSTVIGHNADGTGAVYGTGYTANTGTSAIGGPISVGGTLGFPRIPRGPKAENNGAWQNTLAYAEVGGAWQQCLVYAEVNGGWQLVGA